MTSPLSKPVERFIADLGPVLASIASDLRMGADQPAAKDVTMEAYNLCAAFIDVDGLHTDDELWAFVVAFAPHFDSMLQFATPSDVRAAHLVVDRRHFLEKPSLLFEILLSEDHRRGTTNSWRYYEEALTMAHTVSSLDLHPAQAELDAIERFRTLMLNKMDDWAVPRPGTKPGDGTGTPLPDAEGAAGAPEVAATTIDRGPEKIEVLLAELDKLVGLEAVKTEVRLVTNLLRVQRMRKDRGLPIVESSHHLVFTGNPGTGKTTVARLIARIYRSLGVVTKGHLVETDRAGLVAGYVGQTAIQVHKVAESAFGGVLLIDEAYALARGSETDFGQEAIDTLVKIIEDHRDELVVIAAGYPDEMHDFIESNPGLRSRFPKTIFFPDYTTSDLVAIFTTMAKESSYECGVETMAAIKTWLDAQVRDKGFGNARLARNLFEAAIARQAGRIVDLPSPTDADLCALTPADIGPP